MVVTWFKRNVGVYVDNPTAKKDFRSQLRGNAALLVWGSYLALLLLVAMLAYSSVMGRAVQFNMSIAEVQQNLRSFYQVIMIWLAAMICLITPALTAGSIAVERQRRSLDLLFSAPVSLKGLLVGKLISSYRYTWMLLVLSLPVTAVCVVMGGATWTDVLAAYAILSFAGLVLTSIGLLISSLVNTMGAAILWTYLAVVAYLLCTGFVTAGAFASTFMARDSNLAAWTVGLNPFAVVQAAPTHWVFFGTNVPNWITAGIFSLFMTRIFVLGAASALSQFGARETKLLRISIPLYLFAAAIGLGWTIAGIGSMGSEEVDFPMSVIIVIVCGGFVFLLPYLVSHNAQADRKYRDDGAFNMDRIFVGSPSGNLPFLVVLWLCFCGGLFAGRDLSIQYGGSSVSAMRMGGYPGAISSVSLMPTDALAAGVFWSLAYVLMTWAIGRFISSRAKSLKSARLGVIGALLVIFGLPVPILSIVNAYLNSSSPYGSNSQIWMLHLIYPFLDKSQVGTYPIYVFTMLAIGLIAFLLSRSKRVPPVLVKRT